MCEDLHYQNFNSVGNKRPFEKGGANGPFHFRVHIFLLLFLDIPFMFLENNNNNKKKTDTNNICVVIEWGDSYPVREYRAQVNVGGGGNQFIISSRVVG